MLTFIAAIIGYFAGEFLIGGILFALFGKIGSDPNAPENAIYSWIGKIAGALLAIWLTSN
ncbi:hypothetical protein [Rhodoflexus caldus]|jgi:hypothetical protein|uniref:hypothetical protein n=1 Tax=Rhodoflexus caldus TaxID=2891236 RepID=UPI002029EDD6|nr:hypothetical protein [Rhodoflexus caldus]